MNRQEIISKIAEHLRIQGAVKAELFGSFSRGEDKPDSDIDILVEFQEERSLLDLVRIEQKLSEAVGRKIDLVTEASLSPHIRESVNTDRTEVPL